MIPEQTQKVTSKLTPLHDTGMQRGLLSNYGQGFYGMGYDGGLLNGHHSLLSSHGARQAVGGDVFIPTNKFIFYGHPERNQISGNVPVIHKLSTGQGFGVPFVQTNEYYKPGLGFNVTGINNYPITRLCNCPGVGVNAAGMKGFYGAGMGVFHESSMPEQYSKGISGPYAGWTSTFQEFNNIHGVARVSNHNSGVGLQEFQRIGVQGGETAGPPVKGTPWHYGQVVGHGVLGASAMGTHKDMLAAQGVLSPGYENTMRGYHLGVNRGKEGLANVQNPELYTVMHVGGTNIYHAGSEYHGNGYHGNNGYHRGGYNGGNYNGGGYNLGGYHGDGYYGGGYHGGGYHGSGYYGSGHHRGGSHGVGYHGGLNHGNVYYGNRYNSGGYSRMNGNHGMNDYYESGLYNDGITERLGSVKIGGSLQWPVSNGKSNKFDVKIESDENNKYSIIEEAHLNQYKHDEIQNDEEDSSAHINQKPNKNVKFSASEMLENGTEDANYKVGGNNEITLFPEGIRNESNDTENGRSVIPSYGVAQPISLEQKNVIDDDLYNAYSRNTIRNNKTDDMKKEILIKYTNHSEKMSGNTERNTSTSTSNKLVHETDMYVAVYPSTLSNRGLYAMPYARGLHIDLLPEQTAALHTGSSIQLPGRTYVEGAQTEQTDLKRGDSENHYSSEQQNQQHLKERRRRLGSVTDKLVGVGLGLDGYQSKGNADGKLWTGYDSHMYDHHGVDFGYGSTPLMYQPWYYDYGQYYMSPYHRVHSDHGYDLRQFGVDGSGFVTVDKNLGLNGKLGVGLL